MLNGMASRCNSDLSDGQVSPSTTGSLGTATVVQSHPQKQVPVYPLSTRARSRSANPVGDSWGNRSALNVPPASAHNNSDSAKINDEQNNSDSVKDERNG